MTLHSWTRECSANDNTFLGLHITEDVRRAINTSHLLKKNSTEAFVPEKTPEKPSSPPQLSSTQSSWVCLLKYGPSKKIIVTTSVQCTFPLSESESGFLALDQVFGRGFSVVLLGTLEPANLTLDYLQLLSV